VGQGVSEENDTSNFQVTEGEECAFLAASNIPNDFKAGHKLLDKS